MGVPRPGTVGGLIEAQAAARPGATYFVAAEGPARLTFGELRDCCRSVAAFIARQGVEPGAHVSIVMPNGVATLRILLGLFDVCQWDVEGQCGDPVGCRRQQRDSARCDQTNRCGAAIAAAD